MEIWSVAGVAVVTPVVPAIPAIITPIVPVVAADIPAVVAAVMAGNYHDIAMPAMGRRTDDNCRMVRPGRRCDDDDSGARPAWRRGVVDGGAVAVIVGDGADQQAGERADGGAFGGVVVVVADDRPGDSAEDHVASDIVVAGVGGGGNCHGQTGRAGEGDKKAGVHTPDSDAAGLRRFRRCEGFIFRRGCNLFRFRTSRAQSAPGRARVSPDPGDRSRNGSSGKPQPGCAATEATER